MYQKLVNNKCYIIAEIGGNFTNFEQAKHLIGLASQCKVDAVKLQTFTADTLASKKSIFDMENTGVTSQYELFKKYEIDEDLHQKIISLCKELSLDIFSTPSHASDVDMLEKFNVCAHKIGSDDATNLPFLKYVAKSNKPVILSTGMCTLDEVREAVDTILAEGNSKLAILHAITSYPTHPQDVNLRAILTLKKEFPNIPIGYSDHTIGNVASICAVAMGAQIIEKHFTWDKKADGPDHQLSADPAEMAELVDSIRKFEIMNGHGIKMPAKSEFKTRVNNRKSIVVSNDLLKGELVTLQNISVRRPGFGIGPKYFEQILGRKINKNIPAEEVLKWDDLE